MTDPDPSQTTTMPPAPPSGRGLKIALAVSVALNLAVAGLAAGAWLKDIASGGRSAGPLNFGAFSEVLSRDDRRALRTALIAAAPSFRTKRAAAEEEFRTLVAALRAEPFDPGAVRASLAAIAAQNTERLDLGRSLIEAHLIAMPTPDRIAFADRMEAKLGRRD